MVKIEEKHFLYISEVVWKNTINKNGDGQFNNDFICVIVY